MKYYTVICPVCNFKIMGNWKNKQILQYHQHFEEEHYPKPIILETNEKRQNFNKSKRS